MKARLRLYSPHPVQLDFHNDQSRYRVVSLGRQAGKSTMCLNELTRKAWENPGTRYWFVSPTYAQARIQYRRLIGMLRSCSAMVEKSNQSELRLRVINGSEVVFKSGENFDALRGETLNGAVIDEVRDQHPEIWPQVIRPMLTTTQGWAAFVSTPAGYNFFYDLAQRANKYPDWSFRTAPSTANPLFTQEEFEAARREMSDAEFAQEILAEFRDLTRGKAYHTTAANFLTRSPFVLSDDPESSVLSQAAPYLPIHLYCDWNVTYMGWTLSQFRHGLGHYMFDEIYLERSNTHEAADVLISKLRGYAAEGLVMKADPQIILVGDATGKAQKTSASGETDFTILIQKLKSAGFTVQNRTPESNPHVKDRINTVNARLAPASGIPQAMINPKRCPYSKRDLERVVWKQNATGAVLDQITTPELTHLMDGWGYGICVTNPLAGLGGIGKLSIIPR